MFGRHSGRNKRDLGMTLDISTKFKSSKGTATFSCTSHAVFLGSRTGIGKGPTVSARGGSGMGFFRDPLACHLWSRQSRHSRNLFLKKFKIKDPEFQEKTWIESFNH